MKGPKTRSEVVDEYVKEFGVSVHYKKVYRALAKLRERGVVEYKNRKWYYKGSDTSLLPALVSIGDILIKFYLEKIEGLGNVIINSFWNRDILVNPREDYFKAIMRYIDLLKLLFEVLERGKVNAGTYKLLIREVNFWEELEKSKKVAKKEARRIREEIIKDARLGRLKEEFEKVRREIESGKYEEADEKLRRLEKEYRDLFEKMATYYMLNEVLPSLDFTNWRKMIESEHYNEHYSSIFSIKNGVNEKAEHIESSKAYISSRIFYSCDSMKKYLVIYDFEGVRGLKGYYYKRFSELVRELNIVRLQRSVYLANSVESAKKMAEYLRGLGASVRVFEIAKEV